MPLSTHEKRENMQGTVTRRLKALRQQLASCDVCEGKQIKAATLHPTSTTSGKVCTADEAVIGIPDDCWITVSCCFLQEF
jgi:hypothetical protein